MQTWTFVEMLAWGISGLLALLLGAGWLRSDFSAPIADPPGDGDEDGD